MHVCRVGRDLEGALLALRACADSDVGVGWEDDGVVRYYWFFEAWQGENLGLAVSSIDFVTFSLSSGTWARRYNAIGHAGQGQWQHQEGGAMSIGPLDLGWGG